MIVLLIFEVVFVMNVMCFWCDFGFGICCSLVFFSV